MRVDLVNRWLFGINAGRVKESIRERVLTYQRECSVMLSRRFYGAIGQGVMVPHRAETTALRLVAEARYTFRVEAAGQLWFELSLPAVPAMQIDRDRRSRQSRSAHLRHLNRPGT